MKATRPAGTKASASRGWFCYLLECADGTYYSGVAADVEERVKKHNAGRGAKYTRGRRPVRLAWSRLCVSYAEARALEAELKGWERGKKRQLAMGFLRLGALRRARSG